MTGYRLKVVDPTGSAIARERIEEWDTGADVCAAVGVVGRVGELVAEIASLLEPADVYDSLGIDELRVHQADLTRLSRLGVAATARAGKAYARAGGLAEDGTPSLHAHFRPGRSNHEAAQLAALAHAAESAPATVAALADGDLSPAGAAIIARAIKQGRLGSDPADVERELLAMGRGQTPDEISRFVNREEQRRDGASLRKDEARQHQMRRATKGGQGPPRAAAVLRRIAHPHPDLRTLHGPRRRTRHTDLVRTATNRHPLP